MAAMRRHLVVVLLVASALAAAGCGSDAVEPAAPVTSPEAALDADTRWDGAVLSVDGLSLEVRVGSQPAGDGPCEQRFRHKVIETPESVTVTFDEAEAATTETAPCNAIHTPQVFEIDLEEPLGARALYDGVQAEPRPVWRQDEVVMVEVLPEGVVADELTASPELDQGPDSWTRSAQVPSGPGWDLWIDQGPAGSFTPPTTAPGTLIDKLTINGKEAEMYEYFNHTGRLIHWTEGGLDLTVRAELHTANLSQPQSFANPEVSFINDVLTRIADGVVVP
ncbi:hypothetical protein ACE2AJ_09350 [Aquihabitans daechungensis]|uniref:hypothetical protein n=1 Tax=Aquihabitans daechungensis TaxID=1052257 RepID=UPI003BA1D57B